MMGQLPVRALVPKDGKGFWPSIAQGKSGC